MSKKSNGNINKITDDNIKVMPAKETPLEEAKRRHKEIDSMIDQRADKLVGARTHLIDSLNVTAEKYLTANGLMAALDAVRKVSGDSSDISENWQIRTAVDLAKKMSAVSLEMAEKAGTIRFEEFDKLCDGFYDKEFVNLDHEKLTVPEITLELMRLQLCQGVGQNAQDIVDFMQSSDEEVERVFQELQEFCKGNGIEFDSLGDKAPED